ncbi:SURF1 family protein [Austwickia chelonae]|uniref:SURF1 family protein n=1 Tax=Austwickia chelonae TaxID=100225 RepID=UPI000E25ED22|nr:SURF1 family protein [Austwickia chelonae]
MLRTALTPKWLALLGLVIAVVVGFAALGIWQWDAAHERGVAEATKEAAAKPEAPLVQVMPADGTFPVGALDRKVSVAGTYDLSGQVLVSGRRHGETEGFWVVTPLLVEGAQGRTGGPVRIPVLRGFVAEGAPVPRPPDDRVSLQGVLAQGEPPPNQFRPLPEGQLATLNVPTLLNRWGGEVYNAFVFTVSQTPPTTGDTLTPVPPPAPGSTRLNWRNLGYALQWFFFAVFALYMWWRMVREESRVQSALEERQEMHADQSTDKGEPAR